MTKREEMTKRGEAQRFLWQLKDELILEAIDTGANIIQTAQLVGITPHTLKERMRRMGFQFAIAKTARPSLPCQCQACSSPPTEVESGPLASWWPLLVNKIHARRREAVASDIKWNE